MKSISVMLILFIIVTNSSANAQNNSPWQQIDSLKEARTGHAVVVLPNGNILVSGGEGGYENSIKISSEIYELNTGKWRYTTPMNVPRVSHDLVLMKTGKVLAIGGYKERSCEIFDPEEETWTMTDSIPTFRFDGQTVTLLNNGNILVAGGYRVTDNLSNFEYLRNCEIYDPDIEKWETAAQLNRGRYDHTAVLLNDGRVLVAGGTAETVGTTRSSEIYDPVENSWSVIASMNESRSDPASVLLQNGNVFVSGGDSVGVGIIPVKRSAEVYNVTDGKWRYVADMIDRRSGHDIYYLYQSNQLLVFGGAAFQSTVEDTWETYDAVNLLPIEKGIFPIKKLYEKNSRRLSDGRIVLIGGEDFDIVDNIPTTRPSKSCYIFDIVTSVENQSPISQDYVLYQNYPNPFNPITTIRYYLPQDAGVRIEVYDVLGRIVRVLVDEFENRGYHEVEFSAEDVSSFDRGIASLSSGIYFYKIVSGNYIDVKKMLLIK
ncbi:kelch repeat-containing protein [Melioribacteraceae bacterium 4301-Me]|uniref:kelch repeat-containing protein n=1 Tax=Pyranulibacter aquaticus TaxID=3163344 RepID=UPI003595E472